MCFFIPSDGYVEGEGYRASLVIENAGGHRPTGTWPYTGAAGETRPYFWGHSYEEAQEIAQEQNRRLGLTDKDVTEIVASSMARRSKS